MKLRSALGTAAIILVAAGGSIGSWIYTYNQGQVYDGPVEKPISLVDKGEPLATAEPVPPAPTEPPLPEPVPEPEPAPEPEPEPALDFCPTVGISSQATVDTGVLTLWSIDPTVLAGHNNLGWNYLDNVAVGEIVSVYCGPAFGVYQVVDHMWLPGKVHFIDELPSGYDLVLQTCTGSGDPADDPSTDVDGLGFTLLRRV